MSSLNKVMIIGRLGKDPEVRYTASGTAVCSFSVATDESFKNKAGEKVEKSEWHNIQVWQKLAEICGEYLKKGSLAYFEGRLQTRSWEKDGVTRYTTEIVCEKMQMLGGKGDSNRGSSEGSDPGRSSSAGGGSDYPPSGMSKDDIPF